MIKLIASEVKWVLINEINDSVYYGMMFGETPDRARWEQMPRVLRYVHIDWNKKTVEIKESFLGFNEVLGKDAKSIFAAVMAGHRSSVQKLIIDKNPKSIFTNCDNHSLPCIS